MYFQQVGYDDGILNQLGGASQTEAYIASIWPHLQVNFCHSSLGSKVLVERLPGIKHYAGMTLKGDKPNGVASLKSMYTNTENDLNGADLMLYMGFIGAGFTQGGGIAYLAVVCNNLNDKQKKKQSINNYGSRWEIFGFCLLSFCQNERFLSFLSLYNFEESVFIFQFLNVKMHNYVKHNLTV